MIRLAPRNGNLAQYGKAALCAILALGAAACGKLEAHRGYIVDETLVSAVQPGVDNRDSVAAALGRPTFAGQFDDRDWYYVSTDTRQLAFGRPKTKAQTIIRVRFAANGAVESIDRRGMEQIASISPEGDKTPTLGRERTFLEDIFGNIGAVGAAGMGTGGVSNDPTVP